MCGPTGKSISVSVALALRACVRACEAVCGRVGRRVSPGLGRKIEFSMVPRRRVAAAARTREMLKKRFHFFET